MGRTNLRASKGKYILTGIGIAISSFFIAAVIVLVSSLQGTLNASVNGILSKADNVVVSSYARDNSNTEANIYLDEESIKNIQNDDSVDQSWIVYQVGVSLVPIKLKFLIPKRLTAQIFSLRLWR